jgi:hypothetical protein
MKSIVVFILLIFILSCQKENLQNGVQPKSKCELNSHMLEKIIYKDGSKYLWGGNNENWHFNIDNWTLKECQLLFGSGRETFNDLRNPQYNTVSSQNHLYSDSHRFIIVFSEDKPLVYSINIMADHEVINEVVDGVPIMIVYCIRADFSAVYYRSMCDSIFTFAASGYTYFDEGIQGGIDAFILWDRETESLWWPLIDLGVSGTMVNKKMNTYLRSKWKVITWSEIKENYPNSKVLIQGQVEDIPNNISQFNIINCQ